MPLLDTGGVLIERIASGAVGPQTFQQPHDEWVMLVSGAATIDVGGETTQMSDGDWIVIPGGTTHTVSAVAPNTLWLAVHLKRWYGPRPL